MKKEIKQIINNIAPVYNKPNNKTILETEILFGECFEIKKHEKGWAFGNNCKDLKLEDFKYECSAIN